MKITGTESCCRCRQTFACSADVTFEYDATGSHVGRFYTHKSLLKNGHCPECMKVLEAEAVAAFGPLLDA